MSYKSDIEIAQSVTPKHILSIAESASIDQKYIEQYGNYKAKIDLSSLTESKRENGKLILVTAITPTPAGEGKTTTTIGLADGLKRIGKSVLAKMLNLQSNLKVKVVKNGTISKPSKNALVNRKKERLGI